MYEIGRVIGPDKIIAMARKFGFGQKTGIDIAGEVSGLLPTQAWKKQRFKTNWTIGDTLNLTIGQGFLLATPLQLAMFAASIANNGRLYVPHIAKNKSSYKQLDINIDHLNIVKEAMYKAVNASGGTAYYSRIIDNNYQLAGKTGTAQVQSKLNAQDDLNRGSIAWVSRNHAIFAGFAPFNNPRYAIAVLVDHGGGGGKVAAPIASKIMLEVLKKYN
jgi:penicillin-binding protein 2